MILAIILTAPAMGFDTVEEVLEEIKTNTDIAQGFKKVKEFDTGKSGVLIIKQY